MGISLPPIKSRWYVYLLCDDSCVFYVGVSSDLEKRYKSHCRSEYEVSNDYIIYMRLNDRLPALHIVFNTNDKYAAMACEEAIIRSYVLLGHKLFNLEHNTLYNTRYSPQPTKEQRKKIKRLKNIDKIIQDAKERYYKSFAEAAEGKPYCLDHAERFSQRIGNTSAERS